MTHRCCDDFERAKQPHTDNEEYGPLIIEVEGPVMIGANLPPIRFCPWCGAEVRDVDS